MISNALVYASWKAGLSYWIKNVIKKGCNKNGF
jgi:hypothetical protein